jgi:hypothetical protein
MGQGKNTDLGSIGSVLWGFDILLEVLEKARKEFITEGNKKTHLATCIDHSWHLFNKYYNLTEKWRAYVMATVFDPRNKYQYFYDKWEKKHWTGMKRKTESMFEEFRISDDVVGSLDIPESSMSDSELDLLEDFDISRWRFGNGEQSESELEPYLKSPLMVLHGAMANKTFDVLDWWKANKAEYPTLFRIAVELFSIPGMSVEVERIFSGCVLPFIAC